MPGDKSVSHRVLLLAALADGRSTITGLSDGEDVRHTQGAIEALGANTKDEGDRLVVDGGDLHQPEHDIDVGNAGTGIRLLAGLCAGLPFTTTLFGDESIAKRPMDRIAVPLREMGAVIDGPAGR